MKYLDNFRLNYSAPCGSDWFGYFSEPSKSTENIWKIATSGNSK